MKLLSSKSYFRSKNLLTDSSIYVAQILLMDATIFVFAKLIDGIPPLVVNHDSSLADAFLKCEGFKNWSANNMNRYLKIEQIEELDSFQISCERLLRLMMLSDHCVSVIL